MRYALYTVKGVAYSLCNPTAFEEMNLVPTVFTAWMMLQQQVLAVHNRVLSPEFSYTLRQ